MLDRSAEILAADGFDRAVALKDKLCRFDLEAVERHSVFDDEADYFTSSAWLSDREATELAQRDEARCVQGWREGIERGGCVSCCRVCFFGRVVCVYV